MSSPTPSTTNGDSAQRSDLPADRSDVLPGISDCLAEEAQTNGGQVSSNTISAVETFFRDLPHPARLQVLMGTIGTSHSTKTSKELTRSLTEQQYQ